MYGGLLAHIVDEGFEADFVVSLEDVVVLQNDVLIVAHGVGLHGLFQADHSPMFAVIESAFLESGDDLALTTEKELADISGMQYDLLSGLTSFEDYR